MRGHSPVIDDESIVLLKAQAPLRATPSARRGPPETASCAGAEARVRQQDAEIESGCGRIRRHDLNDLAALQFGAEHRGKRINDAPACHRRRFEDVIVPREQDGLHLNFGRVLRCVGESPHRAWVAETAVRQEVRWMSRRPVGFEIGRRSVECTG